MVTMRGSWPHRERVRYGHSPWPEVPVVFFHCRPARSDRCHPERAKRVEGSAPRCQAGRSEGSARWRRPTLVALGLALLACAPAAAPPRDAVTDDFGDTLHVGAVPRRIVSLNPTTTELLYAIGAGPRVVGRTSYDLYPAEVLKVTDLGQGLRPNVEAVLATRPDLVLLYASADNRDAARRLRASGIATAAWKIDRIADMARVTLLLGQLTGDTAAARRTVDSVHATLDRVRRETASLPHPHRDASTAPTATTTRHSRKRSGCRFRTRRWRNCRRSRVLVQGWRGRRIPEAVRGQPSEERRGSRGPEHPRDGRLLFSRSLGRIRVRAPVRPRNGPASRRDLVEVARLGPGTDGAWPGGCAPVAPASLLRLRHPG